MDDSTGEDLKGFPYAERAHEVRMRQAAGHEASRLRDVERPATVAAWHEAVEAWDQALQRAYPPGFWELTGLLRHGDARGLEEAIRFLEADPWFFRSGYIKERLLRYVRRAPWIPEDIARLQNVLVAAIQARDRREFRHYCSLAAWLDSPEFRSRIAVLLEHDDAGVRRRARWMLDALETQTLPPGPRKRWRPHGRTKSWRRPPSPPPVND